MIEVEEVSVYDIKYHDYAKFDIGQAFVRVDSSKVCHTVRSVVHASHWAYNSVVRYCTDVSKNRLGRSKSDKHSNAVKHRWY